MDEKKVCNWGGNMAVRLNAVLATNVTGINFGDEVVLTYSKGKIIIEAVKK